MAYVKTYFVTFAVFMVIDLIWLGFVAKDLYKKQIGTLMKTNVNWVAAVLFYMIYIVGIIVFVINPAIDAKSLTKAIYLGLFFGFITYMTYDLTNLSTMKDWPLKLTVIDIAWGTFLGGAVSTVSYLISKSFF